MTVGCSTVCSTRLNFRHAPSRRVLRAAVGSVACWSAAADAVFAATPSTICNHRPLLWRSSAAMSPAQLASSGSSLHRTHRPCTPHSASSSRQRHGVDRSSFGGSSSIGGSSRRQHSVACRAALAESMMPAVSWDKIAAKIIGYMVLVGSLFRSLPQIIRCVKKQSVDGLSVASVAAEMYAYLVMTAYSGLQGYCFSTYGDVVACLGQDVALLGLCFHYGSVPKWKQAALVASLAAWTWFCLSGAAGMQVLAALQVATIFVLSFGARLPQIWLNWRRGNTGELSFITCLLNVLGSIARIFTTVALTGDSILLWGVFSGLLMNSIMLYQVVQTALAERRGGAAGMAAQKAA